MQESPCTGYLLATERPVDLPRLFRRRTIEARSNVGYHPADTTSKRQCRLHSAKRSTLAALLAEGSAADGIMAPNMNLPTRAFNHLGGAKHQQC
jgi:hypothetical protein